MPSISAAINTSQAAPTSNAIVKSLTSSSCSTDVTEEEATMESLSSSSSDTHATTSSNRTRTRMDLTVDLTVATNDPESERIELPEALVSPREKQVLETCFDRILLNNFASSSTTRRKHQLVVISGDRRTGKTELSQCLSGEINRIFLYGQFVSIPKKKKMEPLSAFTTIMKQVVPMLQTNHELRSSLQEKLKTELSKEDDVRSALLRTFPDLNLVLPSSTSGTASSSTSTNEARLDPLVLVSYKHRFHNAVNRFFIILAQISPLVLVLDDIHCADVASLELFEYMMMWENPTTQKQPSSSMMVVACYTREESNDEDYYHHRHTNHLFSVLNRWHQQGIKNAESCAFELTEISLCTQSTTSNSITLDQNSSLAPLDLMVVKLAACLGINPIPLNLLEVAYEAFQISNGKTPSRSKSSPGSQDLFEHLSRLVAQGFFSWNSSKQMVWTNDSIEQAAQQLLVYQEEDEDHLDRLLRIVADGLVDTLTETEREYWIYLIVDMHNSAGIIEEKENKTANVSSLNLQAARRAVQSGSCHEACHYLSQGIEALRKAASTKKHHHQDLERTLHRLMIQVSACVENRALLHASSSQLMVGGRLGLLEKLIIQQTQLETLLTSCATKTNPMKIAQQGANRCFQILATEFVMKFPTKDFVQGVTISKGLIKLKAHAKSKHTTTDPMALLKLPTMTKPIQLAAMKLLDTCAHFCYVAGDARFPLVVMKSAELCQKYGRSVYSPLVYTLVGILMVVALDDCKAGVAYVNHALALLTRTLESSAVQKSMEAQAIGLSHFIVLPWSKPIASLLPPLKRAYEISMHGGDVESAIQAISNYIVLAFLSGRNLRTLKQECCVYVTQMQRSKRYVPTYAGVWIVLFGFH
jgi:predicted ATPase